MGITMVKLFKTGDELFDQATDLIKQRDYGRARRLFEKSMNKGGREGDVATAMIALIDLCGRPNEPNMYENLANALSHVDNETIEFGLTEITTREMIIECKVLAENYRALNMNDDEIKDSEAKGKKLLEAAQLMQVQIGSNTLKSFEILKNDSTTGIKQATYLQAIGYECLSKGTAYTDPIKAAEMLQTAMNYRAQIGMDTSDLQKTIQNYARSCRCWICGRPATGEGINFVQTSSDISPTMLKTDDKEVLKAAPNANMIYICRPCYTAVSRRADAIAKQYHEEAMREMREMEVRLLAEIESVRTSAALMYRN